MRIAIIPARGGSKRIPRKNIKDFCGKPIIAYSIEAALKSNLFDHVIITTDDDKIAKVGKAYGAKVPFMRPAKLADDHTPTIPVIKHAIEWVQEHWGKVSYACCIYATAPFVRVADLQAAYNQLITSGKEYVFTATEYPFPIQRAIKVNAKGEVEAFNPEHFNTRSQDLEKAYHDAGQFYWGKAEAYCSEKAFFDIHSACLCLDRNRVCDIDDMVDWQQAEMFYEILQRENCHQG